MIYDIRSDEGSYLIETEADKNTINTVLKLLKTSDIEGRYYTLLIILGLFGYVCCRIIPVIIND